MPGDGVERHGDCLIATTQEPWLDLALAPGHLAGRWVAIRYRSSVWDEPARPVFRFRQADGTVVDRIAAGPIGGAGRWMGRMPANTIGVSVSPTNRVGAFAFAIEGVRALWWPAVIAAGLRWRRKQTRSALLTKLIGWHPESDVNLAWATGSVPMRGYAAWRRHHVRPLDLDGIDRPPPEWRTSGAVQIVMIGRTAEDVARTHASLQAQVFSNWRIVSAEAACDADGLTGVVAAGDAMPPYALGYLVEQARRHPQARLFYGDVLVHDPANGPTPDLKPGWAPRLYGSRSLLGTAVFVRDLATWSAEDRRAYLAQGIVPAGVVEALKPHEVRPLRRLMIETATREDPACVTRPVPPTRASVAVIIPTRDHPALVSRLVASIRAKSERFADRLQIVLVDNGSVAPATKALHADLARADDVLLIEHPGPFNFSLMCNRAAAASRGEVLVFLNDDMEVLSEDWLDRLAAHATAPETGAVGARLTYPDGRLQHVGVLVGMGESAGHFGALAAGDDPGWGARNRVVHEVSAVTGACLAIAREKFEAVGGFDAEHLPIELSDIDLCLKLNTRGWQTIVDPFVHLMHEESVSRGGATLRRLDVYGGERAIFVERWRHVLRDDPTFHPGLSLYSLQAALG